MNFKIETGSEVFHNIAKHTPAELRRGILRFVTAAEGFALDYVPDATGNLRASLTSGLEGDDAGFLKATAPYAVFVHEGTGRYGPKGEDIVITPTVKKALFWEGAEHPVKKTVVKGMKPRPFFRQAIVEAERRLDPLKLFGETLI